MSIKAQLKRSRFLRAVRGRQLAAIDARDALRYQAWLASQSTDQPKPQLAYQPLISIIVPTYNTPQAYFEEMVTSVTSQSYDNWELILVDDASPDVHVREWSEQWAAREPRIKTIVLAENHHIARATNKGIAAAKGDFVALLDHDDVLQEGALYEVAAALNHNKELDFIYTDEDKLSDAIGRTEPFFKPDLNPDLLHSVNYITHFSVMRKSLLDRIGGEDPNYNGAQDWELFLRIVRSIPAENIYHIPQMLYSWRVHDQSTAKTLDAKPYVIEAQRKAIAEDLTARNYKDFVLAQDATYPGQWQLQFKTPGSPKVIVAVPAKLRAMIESQTQYPNFDAIEDSQLDLQSINGEYLAIVSENVKSVTPSWIQELLGDAEREEIGFVQGGIRNSDETLGQAADLISDKATSLLKTLSRRNVSRHIYSTTRHNVRSVKGGVQMIAVDKLKRLTEHSSSSDITTLSATVDAIGCRNLYNPCIGIIRK